MIVNISILAKLVILSKQDLLNILYASLNSNYANHSNYHVHINTNIETNL